MTITKRIILAWLIVCLVLFSSGILGNGPAAYAERPQVEDTKTLEAFLDGVISSRLDKMNITGATLAVVKGEEILLTKGYGYTDLEERKPVDPKRTLFRMGSTSKLLTWTAVMQLKEQGKLDLQEDLNAYLDFPLPARLFKGGEAEPVTIAHLLTHTPGFEDMGTGLMVASEDDMVSLEQYLKQYMPARVFEPGKVMAYSNYGTALAGYVVERIAG